LRTIMFKQIAGPVINSNSSDVGYLVVNGTTPDGQRYRNGGVITGHDKHVSSVDFHGYPQRPVREPDLAGQ